MGKCCVPSCRNSVVREPGLTFHQIPSNEPWRTEWIDVLRKQGVDGLTEWTLVCAEHFTHEDYKMTARKNFLMQTAVPSVFNVTVNSAPPPKKRGRKPKHQQATLRSVSEARSGDTEDDDPTYPRRTGRQRKRKVYQDMVVFMPNPPLGTEDAADQEGEIQTVVANVSDGGEARPVQITIPAADDEPIAFRTETIAQDEESQGYSENANSSDAPSDGLPESTGTDRSDSRPAEFILTSNTVVSNPAASTVSTASGAEQQENANDPPKNLNIIVFSSRPRPSVRPINASTDTDGGDRSTLEIGQSRPKRRCCQIQTQRLVFYKSVIVKLRKRVLALEASLQEKKQELESLVNKAAEG